MLLCPRSKETTGVQSPAPARDQYRSGTRWKCQKHWQLSTPPPPKSTSAPQGCGRWSETAPLPPGMQRLLGGVRLPCPSWEWASRGEAGPFRSNGSVTSSRRLWREAYPAQLLLEERAVGDCKEPTVVLYLPGKAKEQSAGSRAQPDACTGG